jgi:hypothetical protein
VVSYTGKDGQILTRLPLRSHLDTTGTESSAGNAQPCNIIIYIE